jgi:hypothetical protein
MNTFMLVLPAAFVFGLIGISVPGIRPTAAVVLAISLALITYIVRH